MTGVSHILCDTPVNRIRSRAFCHKGSIPSPCVVSLYNLFLSHRKLKKRRSRRSRNLPGRGGPSKRACPSQSLSAILGMNKKMSQGILETGVRQSSPAAHPYLQLCPHLWETVLNLVEVLCPLQKMLCLHIPPLDLCAMSRRGSPKAREKSLKVC